jgi:hypothetical protein
LPVPARELAMLKAMTHTHKTERLAVGRPLGDDDLLLARPDGTWCRYVTTPGCSPISAPPPD